MKQPYIVIEQREGFSRITGHPLTTIIFVGCKDRKEYVTYIDQANRNTEHWSHILRNPQHGFAISNVKLKSKVTRQGQGIINADSEFRIESEYESLDEMLAEIQEIWQEQDRKGDSDRFRDLFE